MEGKVRVQSPKFTALPVISEKVTGGNHEIPGVQCKGSGFHPLPDPREGEQILQRQHQRGLLAGAMPGCRIGIRQPFLYRAPGRFGEIEPLFQKLARRFFRSPFQQGVDAAAIGVPENDDVFHLERVHRVFQRRADAVMMRFVDVLYAVPSLLYIILLMMMFGANVGSIMLGMCISGWVGIARLMRTQVISLKGREYVLAAYTEGAGPARILFKHMFSNAMSPILVQATLAIPQAIFQEAFLSFIGMGISAPQASLGTLAQDARMYMAIYPHQMICPIAMICIIIFALNFISEGLSEALDPTNSR